MENKDKICIIEVNENIRRVESGQPLTRPLRELNENCEFRKKYEDMFDVKKESRKEYNKRPKVKEYHREYYREYNKRPEVKEYYREYNKRPKVKEYHREYYQKRKNER